MNKLSLSLTIAVLVGCPPPQPCPNPDYSRDAGSARSPCQRVCNHFRELKCEEGQPTKDGASCETVCENMQTSNLITYDLDCAAKATSCDFVDRCSRK